MMDCPPKERWELLLSDGLDHAEQEELEDHLEACATCRQTIEDLASGSREIDLAAALRPADVDPKTMAMIGRLAGELSETESLPMPDTVESSNPSLPVIPGYEVLREVGRGGMGVVYQARQIALNRLVAIKMISGCEMFSVRSRARFFREAEALGRIADVSVVHVYDIGSYQGSPFLVMEWAGGGSLADRLAAGALPVKSAATIALQLARSLSQMHRLGILHRDLKPANILVSHHIPNDENPIFKISDFGLAKLLDEESQLSLSGVAIGTPSYMAPEQTGVLENAPHGPATDIYGLGAVLYAMLTGKAPFDGGSRLATIHRVMTMTVAPPRKIRPEIPKDLERICLKCLDRDPSRRYATAEALAGDLRRFLDGGSISSPSRSFQRLFLGVAAVSVVGLAVLATFLITRARDQAAKIPISPVSANSTASPVSPKSQQPLARVRIVDPSRVQTMNLIGAKRYREAIENETRRLATLAQESAARPDDAQLRYEYIESCIDFYHMCRTAQTLKDSEPALQDATKQADKFTREAPDDFLRAEQHARTYFAMGEMHLLSDRSEESLKWLDRARSILEPWHEAPSHGPKARGITANILEATSHALNRLNRMDEADARLRDAHMLNIRNKDESTGDIKSHKRPGQAETDRP